ncbi:MAG: FAD-binding protein, partial [SAR324 cluster bacterium]|nr:FAD-binding protein [SAR324 cluster bacterium]
MNELAQALKGRIAGEVRFDAMTRQLYATDASMFQVEPLGVVVPKHEEDVLAAMEEAARFGVPVLPRGGGTALAGQAVGEALILDFSTHFHRVLELNIEEGWVWVQPGVVQDQLNQFLSPHGFLFGPDTATSNRATLGGMAGNNSAGKGSVVYGKTVDHVIEAKTVLADATLATFGPLDAAGLEAKLREDGAVGRIYRDVLRVAEESREEVERRFPKLLRRVSGYNLDEVLKSPTPNLASLLVGSEGTLALTTALKLKICPKPKAKALLVIHFDDLIDSVAGNELILRHGPSAMELVDERIIGEALASPVFRGKTGFIEGRPAAIIIVEFHGDTPAELVPKLDALERELKAEKIGYAHVRATEPAQQELVWNLRKSGLGLLMGTRIDAKPVAFVEDTAVPPERLPAFLRDFKEVIDRHGVDAGYYGHASVGCLHIRPFIDLRTGDGIGKMMSIFEEVASLVAEHGGTISGEHGDGLARSWLIERFFGKKLHEAFRAVKAAFDPEGRMNPGKIVDGPPPTEHLRLGEDYARAPLETTFDFSRHGGFHFAIEMCNGNGQCRKMDGTMCPSFQATRDDRHSTRGRANALRGVISGRLGPDAFTSEAMHEVMDLCLECKACKTECPSKVDMAKLKYEFLHQYQRKHGVPLRSRLFGQVERLNRIGCATAPVSNWVLGHPLNRALLSLIGVAPERTLPPFARERFSTWFRRRNGAAGGAAGAAGEDPRPPVVLFHDTFMEYNYPSVGRAAVAVLEAAGLRVILPDKRCCGRPMISKGFLEEGRATALHNLAVLKPYAEAGVPIVGVEPSCILTLKDDYLDLVPGEDAERVAEAATTIDEFLEGLIAEGKLSFPRNAAGSGKARQALLHGHCHQKSLVGMAPTLEVLRAVPGLETREIPSGCCGMAGSFGYEKEKYALSMAIGEQRLLPAVREAPEDTLIVADGVSCRQQIRHATGREPKHLVEVVAEA